MRSYSLSPKSVVAFCPSSSSRWLSAEFQDKFEHYKDGCCDGICYYSYEWDCIRARCRNDYLTTIESNMTVDVFCEYCDTVKMTLLTTYNLQLTTYDLRLATCYLLLTTYNLQFTTYYLLLTTYYILLTTSY